MPTLVEQWRTERDELLDRMQAIVETEERTEANVNTLRELETRAAEVTQRLEDHARFTETRAAADMLDTRAARASIQTRDAFGERRDTGRPLSFGEEWVASEQFRNYHGHGSSGIFEYELEERAPILTTEADWDRALYRPQRVNIAEPAIEFPLFGVVNVEAVSTGNVDWVEYGYDDGTAGVGGPDSTGNAAAVVAEGAGKPESALVAKIREAALETIAHWVQVSRQSLEDSNRMRQIVDGLLIRGVRYKEHTLLADTIASATLPTHANADLLAAIRGAIGAVEGMGYYPNAVMLNPADWADLDIAVMGSTLNGPVVRQTFWGLTVVSTPKQAAGSATVGDFRSGVSHFRRSSASVYVSDSHASTFTSNIFTLLGEARAKSAIVRPNALCKTAAAGTQSSGSSSSGSSTSKRR